MTDAVIDASALLALLNGEPGAEIVAGYLTRGIISSVNLSEVVAKLADGGIPEHGIRNTLVPLGLNVSLFDEGQAYTAGLLRAATRDLGLSSGDRACLGLAKTLNVAALTADRAWAQLSIGVTIKVIR